MSTPVVLAILLALAVPATAPVAPKAQRLSGDALAERAVERPQPALPRLAKAAGIEGSVVVEVRVDEAGRVTSARAVSGHPLLRDAAVEAAREWVFEPTRVNGVAVQVIGTVTFDFRPEPREFDGPPLPATTETLYAHRREAVTPDYPPEARRAGIEGMVQVRVTVSPDGQVTRADALSGPEELMEAAAEATREWRFEPIEVDGKEVAVTGDVYFLFQREAFEVLPVLENGGPYLAEERQVTAADGLVLASPAGSERGGVLGGVPAAGAPEFVRLSGGVLAGAAIERPQPEYPRMASAAGVEGVVVIEVIVDETGRVASARVVSGHPLLREAALEAARGWVFTPTELEGVRVKVIGTITFNFRRS